MTKFPPSIAAFLKGTQSDASHNRQESICGVVAELAKANDWKSFGLIAHARSERVHSANFKQLPFTIQCRLGYN